MAGFIFFGKNSASPSTGTTRHYRPVVEEILGVGKLLLGDWANIMIVGDMEAEPERVVKEALSEAGARLHSFDPAANEGEGSAWNLVHTLLQQGPVSPQN